MKADRALRADAARRPALRHGWLRSAYAVLGAQRATKIMGIFARLDLRDGKPHYLGHLPRIEYYLKRACAIQRSPSSRHGMKQPPAIFGQPLNDARFPTTAMVFAAGSAREWRPFD